jgi:hypothetical protein
MSVEYFAAYYAIYVVLSLGITIWVGHTLSSNGLVFLIENFEGREPLARSINHLLLVGFYLINIGFMTLMLRYGGRPDGAVEAIEYLSTKIGMVVVLLGVMHFINMFVLVRFRRSGLFRLIEPQASATVPPFAPTGR